MVKQCLDKMWQGVKKALRYVRINDEKNRLSLTNIAMIIVLWKLWETDATTFKDITALAVAVIGYQFKRLIEKPVRKKIRKHLEEDESD